MDARGALLLAFVVPMLTLAGSASAQTRAPSNEPTSDQRALAEMLFYSGKGMMADGHLAQACDKFAESYRLDPATGTLLNLAVCHEQEGKIASAWGEFHQALTEAKHANRPDRIDLATESIKRVELDLPFLTITVPASVKVDGLEIRRNGVPLLSGAWDTELPIDPGKNDITITAPLYKPETRTITIQKRQHLTVKIDPLELAPVDKPPPPFWTPKRKLGAGVFVGGAVVAAAGGVFGGLALAQKSTSDQSCPTKDGQVRCTSAGSNASSNAVTDAWIADFGVGVGAAAIVVGGLLYALGGAREDSQPAPVGVPPKEAASWRLRVVSGAHGGEAFLTHAF